MRLSTISNHRRKLLVAGASTLAAPYVALAQSAKPVSLIVSYPAGGGADLMARLIAPHFGRLLGQNVIVDNKPGASGQIAAAQVAKAAPDGHTLLLDASSFAVNPSLFAKLPYDSDKDFTPLGVLALFPNVLVCHPGFEAKTVKDVVHLAKASPAKIAYASSGNGSAQHLAGALFESRTSTQMVHVPYRGGGPALNDVMGGQVPLFFANVASSLGHIQSGRLRALGVTSRLPTRALADIPSIEQSGVANYEVLEWNPVLAPAGMSAALQTRLREALAKTMAEPEVLARVRSLSGEVFSGNGPAALQNFLKTQQTQWARLVRERSIVVG